MSQQYLQYLNKARQSPNYFIPIIQQQLQSFVNDKQMPLSEGVLYQTNQGKAAWHQAKSFLKTQKPLPPFLQHSGLCLSAQQHQLDLCNNNIFGHVGSDGSTFSKRILKYCKKGPGAMAELIGADFDIKGRNSPLMTILGLIIDDGVKDRGHRKTIFSPTYRYVGWSSGRQQQKNITVFNLTENIYQTNVIGSNTADSVFYKKNQQEKYQPKKYNNTTPNYNQNRVVGKDITNTNTNTNTNIQNQLPQSKSDFSLFISNNNLSELEKKQSRRNLKIKQKMENNKIYFDHGAKIIQAKTQFIYTDGSVEENLDRRTIYLDP